MVPSRRAGRRPLLRSTLFALVLAVGTVAGAVGRDATPRRPEPVAVGPGAGQVHAAGPAEAASGASAWVDPEPEPRYDGRSARRVDRTPVGIGLSAPPVHVAKALPASRSTAPSDDHRGRNHLWMPALGIDKSVSSYACSNGSYPGNRVYRWGCGGSNNVYLFGHAHSVFKPLHDAYVGGRLKKGMKLFYADGGGGVHAYSVSWWKLTTATKGTWAYQGLSRPSLTLQTCVGSRSQYRLIVRLTQVD